MLASLAPGCGAARTGQAGDGAPPAPTEGPSAPAPSDVGTASPQPSGHGSTDPGPVVAAPPEPEPLRAPDGTVMHACGTPPEGMACVPGGPYLRGNDDGPSNQRPRAEIWISTFYMDVNEVTYAEYKACEKAGKCDKAGPQYIDFDRPRQPINGIRWYDADRFCRAQGKRLPTESEWEKAARGTDGRTYPWGEEIATCERAIIYGKKEGRGCGLKKAGKNPETGRPWEVGSREPNQFGLYDMAGNSWEWVSDWYTRSYADCGEDCQGVDPKGPCGGAEPCPGRVHKIVRGGSWYWPADYATTTYRRAHVPSNEPFHHFGFRCAADGPGAASP